MIIAGDYFLREKDDLARVDVCTFDLRGSDLRRGEHCGQMLLPESRLVAVCAQINQTDSCATDQGHRQRRPQDLATSFTKRAVDRQHSRALSRTATATHRCRWRGWIMWDGSVRCLVEPRAGAGLRIADPARAGSACARSMGRFNDLAAIMSR